MEKNTNINLSNESSAHNDINQITLKKKTLKPEDDSINANQSNQDNKTNNNVYGNNKEDFIPKDANYHSGIIERREIKKNREPSILIIVLIIIAVFLGEIIYEAITNKPNSSSSNEIQSQD